MHYSNKVHFKKVLSLLSFVTFYSCGLFLSPYSAYSYSTLTQLKVLHMKFIETNTKGDDHEYNKEKIDDSYNTIDTKFREALEYEKQVTNDNARLEAFEILYDELKSNYKQLLESVDLFSKPFSEELLGEIGKNYDLAIKGELSRRNSPTN